LAQNKQVLTCAGNKDVIAAAGKKNGWTGATCELIITRIPDEGVVPIGPDKGVPAAIGPNNLICIVVDVCSGPLSSVFEDDRLESRAGSGCLNSFPRMISGVPPGFVR
jgi:hypothetical protein